MKRLDHHLSLALVVEKRSWVCAVVILREMKFWNRKNTVTNMKPMLLRLIYVTED